MIYHIASVYAQVDLLPCLRSDHCVRAYDPVRRVPVAAERRWHLGAERSAELVLAQGIAGTFIELVNPFFRSPSWPN